MIEDSPLTIQNWSPKNYSKKYRGKIPLWQALAISSNVATVRLIKKSGVDAVIQTAREMGISTPLANDLTIGLGSNGVRLFDMVVAYGAFANGGFKVKPYSVERVENSRGITIYENSGPKIVKVINFETAAGMTYMLRKVVEVGTGKAANIAQNIAGKTGTTNDYRDAWFVGYTPDVVTGVWLGNDNNSKLPGITGGSLPARIFAEFMKVAVQNFPKSVFDYPKMNGSSSLSPVKIEDDVDETVDETEEQNADKIINEITAPIPQTKPKKETKIKNIQPQVLNQVEQSAPVKPKKQFNTAKTDLVEYDDEKSSDTVPLPGI